MKSPKSEKAKTSGKRKDRLQAREYYTPVAEAACRFYRSSNAAEYLEETGDVNSIRVVANAQKYNRTQ